MLRVGTKIRNVLIVGIRDGGEHIDLECPFCKNRFSATRASITLNRNMLSCGCLTAKEAKAEYYERMVAELERCGFIITVACRNVGISYNMYKLFSRDPEFIQLVEEAQERKKDLIESAFIEKLQEGNMRAIELGMRSKLMADRGYGPQAVESQQIELDLGEKIIDDVPAEKKTRKRSAKS